MSRLSYRRELWSWSLLPVMLGGIQGGTISVVVKKTFSEIDKVPTSQLNLAVALVAASQAIGMLMSPLWAAAGRGRRKVPLISAVQVATSAFILLIAFVPRSWHGMWMLVACCIMAMIFWSGVTTLRAGVWRANYAHTYRPSIFGRLTIIHSLIVALVGIAIGVALDQRIENFRYIFPILATTGFVGAILYRGVPFRRESRQLLDESQTLNEEPARGAMALLAIVKSDRWFRNYLVCMFLIGIGNLMIHPILAIVLDDLFAADYLSSIAITTAIPLTCMTIAIPIWSRRLERFHVIDYRSVHAWSFVVVSSLVICGVATRQIAFLYIAAVAIGIGWGGGAPAWNLGHQHFAPRNLDAQYMSIHITLTGIRGILGPLISVSLYSLVAPRGWHVLAFIACLVMNLAGALGFVWIARKRTREQQTVDSGTR